MKNAFENIFLRGLDSASIDRLQLREDNLLKGQEIWLQGDYVHRVFFIEAGLASLSISLLDGYQVELALCGNNGILGVSALAGGDRSPQNVRMLTDARANSARVQQAANEASKEGHFQNMVLQELRQQEARFGQATACIAHHTVEERLAKWLLLSKALSDLNELSLSQAQIAEVLGTRRATVTAAFGKLEKANLITHMRGTVRLLDPKGLKEVSCECYQSLIETYPHTRTPDTLPNTHSA